MRSPFSIKWIYLIEKRSFGQKHKFSNKNDMVIAWRNFENIFRRPLFIIIFRPEILKFHPYSILTGDTRVEFVIFCVLRDFISQIFHPPIWCWLTKCRILNPSLSANINSKKEIWGWNVTWQSQYHTMILVVVVAEHGSFFRWQLCASLLWRHPK